MMNEVTITSTQNERIKHLLLLQQKSALRKTENVFVVEGARELMHCIEKQFEIESVFVCEEIFNASLNISDYQCFKVNRKVYDRIALRGSTEGIIAIVKTPNLSLNSLRLSDNPLLVVLERVEKPGNLGAVLRSADASGVDAVIVCDPLTDIWNPNVVRSSVGGIFSVPCVACSSEECIAFLKQKGIQILTAQLQDSELYYATDMTCPTAIVMGTESTGLTQQWRAVANRHIRIPMLGKIDSLNVSVSAAILMFEAVRQRS